MFGVGSGRGVSVADAVADAGDGDDVAGVAGVFIELAAESSDVGAEGAPAAGGVHAPDVAEELCVRDDIAGVEGELAEQFVFGGGELDGLSGEGNAALAVVD